MFQFMSSSSSSERPSQQIAKKVAEDLFKTKQEGGKIIVVSGPVIGTFWFSRYFSEIN